MKFYYTQFFNDIDYYDYVPDVWQTNHGFTFYRIREKEHDIEYNKSTSYHILNNHNEVALKHNFVILEIKED